MSRLWAITSYFNPAGYLNRLSNYHAFRRNIQVPLATIELSFDGRFQLSHDDADVVLQVQGHDVMWQKERLLNLLLEQLPDECDHVAWVDCDVIFESDDWSIRASKALERYALLHLYQKRVNLCSGQSPGSRVPVCLSMTPGPYG